MDDEAFEGHQNGKPRRHDGRDPWSFVPRARAVSELAAFTTADPTRAPRAVVAGDAIAVLIERERHDTQGRYEEVWLDVEAVEGDVIHATFDSQPTYVRGVSSGDPVRLEAAAVLTVRGRR